MAASIVVNKNTLVFVQAFSELTTPETYEKQNECVFGFARSVRAMIKKAQRLNPLSNWGWGRVHVTVRLKRGKKVAQGTASLGACSYRDEFDFIESSGYFEDLVAEATAEAERKLKSK